MWGDINIHTDINANIDIHIIIDFNEQYWYPQTLLAAAAGLLFVRHAFLKKRSVFVDICHLLSIFVNKWSIPCLDIYMDTGAYKYIYIYIYI